MTPRRSFFKCSVFLLVCLFVLFSDTYAWRRRRRRRSPSPPPSNVPVTRDTTPPIFTYCPNYIGIYYTSTTSTFVSWRIPTATDETDSSVTVETSDSSPGSLFSEGNHTVLYTARDNAGNSAQCVITFTVRVLRCPVPNPPIHGRIVGSCSRLKESRCEFECDQGYSLTHDAPRCVVTMSDAYWEGPIPSCTGSQCDEDTLVLPNGHTVIFNQTEAGNYANSSFACSANVRVDHTVSVTRLCSLDADAGAFWQDPEYPQCPTNDRTVAVTTVTSQDDFTSDEAINKTRSQISNLIADSANIQLGSVVSVLSTAIDEAIPSPKAFQEVFTLVDMALDIHEDTFEEDGNRATSETVLSSVDAFLTRTHSETSSNFTFRAENVVAAAVKVGRTTLPLTAQISGPSSRLDDDVINFSSCEECPEIEEDASSVFFPESVLDYIPDGNDTVGFSVFVLDSLKLFQPNSSTQQESSVLISPVLSITIEGAEIVNLPDPVVFNFSVNSSLISEGVKDELLAKCVFWKRPTNVSGGVWSQEGCQTDGLSSKGLVSCRCNHLTSFAVLMDLKGAFRSSTLDIISLFGCIASILCLILTIGFLVGKRSLRRRYPQQIMINLSSALLGLYLVFVVGVDRPSWGIGCTIIAALLHYFSLAAVAWMGVEAFSMYLMFIKVVNSYIPKMLLKTCLAGWGGPLLIVCTTVAINWKAYHNSEYCFMTLGPSFYFAQLLPIAIILTVNTVVFTVVIYKLTCGRKMASLTTTMEDLESKAAVQRAELVRRLQNAIAIGTLLGLSWVFGFMAIGGARFFFSILFVIFTSLQGVAIFLLFCVRQPEVRQHLMLLASRLIRLLTGRMVFMAALDTTKSHSSNSGGTRQTSSRQSNATVLYSAGKPAVSLNSNSAASPNSDRCHDYE